ncbi:MAG: glycosyltransferase [Caldilineaceae bacterium]
MVPIFNAFEHVLGVCRASPRPWTRRRRCCSSTTPAPIPASKRPSPTPQFGPNFGYFRKESNSGFVGSCNLGFAAAERRDVVLVNSDTLYPPGWLDRLRAAAYARANVATATPLTNHGSMVSVPQRNRPVETIPGDLSVEEADARIQAASRRLRPLIPTGIGHCTYVRRGAGDHRLLRLGLRTGLRRRGGPVAAR